MTEAKQSVRIEARECAGSGIAVAAVIGQDDRPLAARISEQIVTGRIAA